MMPTNDGETLYQRYAREAEIDAQIQLRSQPPDSTRSDPIQPDPLPSGVHASLVAEALKEKT